ncbi:PDZ domain-containing protein [Noviherbaspirillum agri]
MTIKSIGVGLQDVTPAVASSFGLRNARGAIVTKLEPGAAYEAGVQVGDIFLTVDGHPVPDATGMVGLLAAADDGSIIETEIWRSPYSMPLKIVLPDAGARRDAAKEERAMARSSPIAGLVVSELSSNDRCRLGVDSGLLVVSADGAAAQADIRRGDVVLRLNAAALVRITDLYAAAKELAGREVALLILRDGQPSYHVITLPATKR